MDFFDDVNTQPLSTNKRNSINKFAEDDDEIKPRTLLERKSEAKDDRNILAYKDSDSDDDIMDAFSNLADVKKDILPLSLNKLDKESKPEINKKQLYLKELNKENNTKKKEKRDNSEMGLHIEPETKRDLSARRLSFKQDVKEKGSIIRAHTPRSLHRPKSYIGNDANHRFSFLMSPIDSEDMMKFKIYRSRGYLSTTFKMFYENTGEFVLCSEKQWAMSVYYHISMLEDVYSKNRGFLGKLRGDFYNQSYTVYSPGINQKEFSTRSKSPMRGGNDCREEYDEMREELGCIQYTVEDIYSPRVLKVLIPGFIDENDYRFVAKSITSSNTLLDRLQANSYKNDFLLENKKPKYNRVRGTYTLDFKGRAKIGSVKNFQLVISNQNKEDPCFQLCKVSDDEFNCDFSYPLSPLQAFAIALSSFDNKA